MHEGFPRLCLAPTGSQMVLMERSRLSSVASIAYADVPLSPHSHDGWAGFVRCDDGYEVEHRGARGHSQSRSDRATAPAASVRKGVLVSA